MRLIPGLVCLLFLVSPAAANGQSFQLQAAAGPTVIDAGASVTAGIGFTAGSRLSILIDVEHTHIPSEILRDERGRVTGASRRGSLTLGAAGIRLSVFPRDRFGPYGLAGFAAGVSRPNVNEHFPAPVTNEARLVFFGGGLHVPIGEHASVFADARFQFGVEGHDGIIGVVPIRAGVSWKF